MAEIQATCWLIADAREPLAKLVRQFADLRGVPVRLSPLCDGMLPPLPSTPGNLIAIGAESFERLASPERKRVEIFCRGWGDPLSTRFQARPIPYTPTFCRARFLIIRERSVSGYRLSTDSAIPKVLQNELSVAEMELTISDLSATPATALLSAEGSTGKEAVSIFAFRYGKGLAIYDLLPSAPVGDDPILFRFTDAGKRCSNLGPLIAIDSATGRDNLRPSSFNLVIDDRPVSFDYFSRSRLNRFLNHLEALFPGVHVDFAWTPNQRHPSHRYVSTLKAFNCGFVWHGYLQHIDHNKIPSLTKEFAAGKSAVRALSRRFGISFQPIMIFPFELSDYVVLSDLSYKGFLASVERGDARPEYECLLPGHLQYSTPALEIGKGFIPILRRYPMKMLTRQMMLALATLGYPIIAAAHPGDLLLRRFVRPGASREAIHHFDTLLKFATVKCLKPSSLEEIAASLSPPMQSYSTKAPDFVRNAATHEV